MRVRGLSAVLLVLTLSRADAQSTGRRGAGAGVDLAAFEAYVAKAARDWQVPGLAIAIVKDDSVVFAKGFGVEELGKPTPASEHTRFAIGSTTKAMTTVALGMLIDEGKLTWDTRIIDILPDFRLQDAYATRELTVRDILTHRTGLPSTDLLWLRDDLSGKEMIRRLRYVTPAWSFRSTWDYQNNVYAIGGEIIEKISGMPWDQFIRTRIFAPLGMNESEPLVAGIFGKPHIATPHDIIRDTVRIVPVRTTDPIASVGSVWSSVSDMAKWMRFILDSGRVGNTRLIQQATFVEMLAPQIRAPMPQYPALRLARPHFFSYALGWFVQDYQGQTVWMHTGSINGMAALIGLMPDRRLGVYVLENLDHAELRHALMYQVFDMYAGKTNSDWSRDLKSMFADMRGARQAGAVAPVRPNGPPPSLTLEKYAGTYVDSAYGDVEIRMENGALRARFGKEDLGVLEPWQYESFRAKGPPPENSMLPMTFVGDGNGGVASLRVFGVTFTKSRSR